MAAEKYNGRAGRRTAALYIGPVLALAAALLASGYERAPIEWRVGEVPVAFWAWQSESPSEADVRRAVVEAGARELFLRAGQIDFEGGRLMRIRAVKGRLPRSIQLHLVYNATRSFLNEFERISPEELATTVLALFDEDAARAERDGARVAGLQLDIDVPTRLLARYAQTLRRVRESLPPGLQLAITGLPAWMESPELKRVLAEVDYWAPQLYGARVPDRMNRLTPISSPESVAAAIERARRLGRPFYAGLSAYGYALHYSRDGSLLSLRGDLDPNLVAQDANLEMVERRPFGAAGEWCYVFRARGDGVIDGTVVREGEYLVLDMPSAGSLRECARAVRRRAGEKLLGICVFRVPSSGDPTTLSIEQI
ncbi:MAG TPA: DUF3142 domain-containing protein, partial [Blastocatellia bacterium]|nr:DUF3142 domain-containing protein [Blastocatellia bacterium]